MFLKICAWYTKKESQTHKTIYQVPMYTVQTDLIQTDRKPASELVVTV